MSKKKATESTEPEFEHNTYGVPFVAGNEEVAEQMETIVQMETIPRRKRRASVETSAIDLDPKFVNDPTRMQYALLLALLLRNKDGSAKFSAKDFDLVDTDYNILFARTLDGKSLEVTVVSAQSGIIRSPKGEQQWPAESPNQYNFSPMPPAPQTTPTDPPNVIRFDNTQHEVSAEETPEQRFLRMAGIPNGSSQTTYHLPFEVGHSPSSAVDLGAMQTSLQQQRVINLDNAIAEQEAAAIQREGA